MDGRVILLADVAILRLDNFAKPCITRDLALLEVLRRNDIGRGEHRLAAQRADAGIGEHALVALQLLRLALADAGFHQPPPLGHVRAKNLARRLEQTCALLDRQLGEQRAVASDLLQQFGGGFETSSQGGVFHRLKSCAIAANYSSVVSWRPMNW